MLVEKEDFGKYGFGTIRTIEQDGEFARIDLPNKTLMDV
jgi:hypothetical protein